MRRTSAPAAVHAWLARRAGAPGSLSLAVTVVLFVALSLAGVIAYDGFLAPQVFLNLLIDNAFLLVVAVGMTFVILTGGIDLSVGSNMYVSAAVAGLIMQNMKAPVWLGLLVCLGVGLLFGAVNGFLITKLKIVPFIATLGTMSAARGAARYRSA